MLTTNSPLRCMLAAVSLINPSGPRLEANMQSGGSLQNTLKKLNGAALTTPVGPSVVIRAVGEAEVANVLVHFGERGPLRDAGGAVHLDRLVDDLAGALRHHRLDHADPDAGFLVAEHVHGFRRLQH